MAHKYSATPKTENFAKACGLSVPISRKQSVEICSMLRHKKLLIAKKMLEEVTEMKRAVPYKRFNMDVPHKPGKGFGAGKYPVNTSKEILKILQNVEANAQVKGLNTSLLVITHMNAHGASRPRRAGRVRGLKKRAHVEIIVEKVKKTKKEKKVDKK